MKRLWMLLVFLVLLAACSAASAEVKITYTPEHPRVGDYVDVTVAPDRENYQEIAWELLYDEEKSITYRPVNNSKETKLRTTASFRPRKECTCTLRITVSYGKKDKETAEVTIPVSGFAPAQEGPEVIYSQKDGWWYKKWYSKSNGRDLQKSACAIFTLSHALQRMGITDESVQPEVLGKTYSYFYRPGEGTNNSGLIAKAAEVYDFVTQQDLLRSVKEITASLKQGDLLTFSIVDGHIALGDALSEDGTKVHIVDSASGATFDRIRTKGNIFYRNADGTFTQTDNPDEIPGSRWFFETHEYGGMEYWMSIDYCALRGMRMIRKPWLKADPGTGAVGVSVEYVGAMMSKVTRGEESWRVPTRELILTGDEPHAPKIAVVTAKKGTTLKDGTGKVIPKRKAIRTNALVLVLEAGEDAYYAWWDNTFGYLTPADVTLLDAEPEGFKTGLIAMNGSTSGTRTVAVHRNPKANSDKLESWKTGTPVCVVEKKGDFYLLEAKGFRGWVHEKYVILDQAESAEASKNMEGGPDDGQEINKGK